MKKFVVAAAVALSIFNFAETEASTFSIDNAEIVEMNNRTKIKNPVKQERERLERERRDRERLERKQRDRERLERERLERERRARERLEREQKKRHKNNHDNWDNNHKYSLPRPNGR